MCFGKRSSVDEGRQGSAFRIGFLNNAIFKDLMKMFFNRDLGESFNRKLYKVFFTCTKLTPSIFTDLSKR